MAKRVSVIDIGSNSIRMVTYEKTSRFAFHILDEAKSKVRISENAYKNGGNLQEVPMQRTFDALENFLSISNSLKARKILCVATSALRDAPNKKVFLDRVKKNLKLSIKVIDGEKEAYFGALACANLLPTQQNALSIDIGGGSTEFSIITNKDVSNTVSIELGTVRLKELFFDTNKISEAKKYVDEKLKVLEGLAPSTLVGIGGTFRAVSSAIMSAKNHPLNKLHAYEYDIETLQNFISSILKTTTDDELKALKIKNNRLDVIKPGVLILSRVLKKLSSLRYAITSGVGVREGVYLRDMLRSSNFKMPEHYNPSVRYIIDANITDTTFSNQLNKLSKSLFDLTCKSFEIDNIYRKPLSISAKLYPAGANIHYYSKNLHSYYLVQTALEYGFRHQDIALISILTKYAKKKLPSKIDKNKYKDLLPDSKILNYLSFILSLSVALLAHRPRNIDFNVEFDGKTLHVKSNSNLYLAKEATFKLEKIDNLDVVFVGGSD